MENKTQPGMRSVFQLLLPDIRKHGKLSVYSKRYGGKFSTYYTVRRQIHMEFISKLYSGQSAVISWLISIVGTISFILPTIIVWKIAKKKIPKWKFTLACMVFGALAIPFSFWLYFQYFLGPIRALIFGFIGLILLMFHVEPFEEISVLFLLEATNTQSVGVGKGITKHVINGGFTWLLVYGAFGALVDFFVSRRKPSSRAKSGRVKKLNG
ncbi:MAG: biotin transporter BioY [Nitrospirae bacterium]|nr:biotin transporter BioY [Candidatus Manganitrophaceae bacterium]